MRLIKLKMLNRQHSLGLDLKNSAHFWEVKIWQVVSTRKNKPFMLVNILCVEAIQKHGPSRFQT